MAGFRAPGLGQEPVAVVASERQGDLFEYDDGLAELIRRGVNPARNRRRGADDCGQWVRGNSPDTFCPGAGRGERDEIADPQLLRPATRVNGEVVQSSSVKELNFGVAEPLSVCSATSAWGREMSWIPTVPSEGDLVKPRLMARELVNAAMAKSASPRR